MLASFSATMAACSAGLSGLAKSRFFGQPPPAVSFIISHS